MLVGNYIDTSFDKTKIKDKHLDTGITFLGVYIQRHTYDAHTIHHSTVGKNKRMKLGV